MGLSGRQHVLREMGEEPYPSNVKKRGSRGCETRPCGAGWGRAGAWGHGTGYAPDSSEESGRQVGQEEGGGVHGEGAETVS